MNGNLRQHIDQFMNVKIYIVDVQYLFPLPVPVFNTFLTHFCKNVCKTLLMAIMKEVSARSTMKHVKSYSC